MKRACETRPKRSGPGEATAAKAMMQAAAASRIGADDSVEVSVNVRNTGQRAGDEVVQLYIRDTVSSVTRPVIELKGFQRLTLAPGEMKTAVFKVGPEALSFWDANMKRTVEPGEFEILVGPNSVDLKSTVLTVGSGTLASAGGVARVAQSLRY